MLGLLALPVCSAFLFCTVCDQSCVLCCAGKVRQPGSKSLWGVLRCQDPIFVDLLEKCLRWDPAERLTPEQAMAHPWMQDQMTNSPGTFRWVLQAALHGWPLRFCWHATHLQHLKRLDKQQQHGAPACLVSCRTSRSRQDQAQAPGTGKLQPTNVMAAAAAALGAGGALGKAAAKAVGIPINACSNSGALCSAEYSDTAPPGQHNYTLGAPAAAAAVTGGAAGCWQGHAMQVDASLGAAHTPRTLHTVASDTSQSGIDCTPRQVSGTAATAAAAGMSTATPAVMQGALSAAAPVVTSGPGTTAGTFSNGSLAGYTPRAMETDAPALASKAAYGIGSNAVTKQQMVNVLASTGQQPQVVVQQQQRTSGRDVGGPDQAALTAASNLLKMQASMAAAAANGSTAPTYMASGALGQSMPLNNMQQQAVALMQRQHAAAGAAQQQIQAQEAAWPEQAVGAEQQLEMFSSGVANKTLGAAAAAAILSNAGVNQQLLLLQQQLLQNHDFAAAGMAVVGQAVSNNGSGTQQQQHLGQEQFDRLLPRLQR